MSTITTKDGTQIFYQDWTESSRAQEAGSANVKRALITGLELELKYGLSANALISQHRSQRG